MKSPSLEPFQLPYSFPGIDGIQLIADLPEYTPELGSVPPEEFQGLKRLVTLIWENGLEETLELPELGYKEMWEFIEAYVNRS